MTLNYTKGVDILQDTINVATHFGFIDSPALGTFIVLDPETGEQMLDSEGKPVKIRGKNNLKPYFEQHLDLWHKLYDKVYEKLKIKDDPYIKSFEAMMNINMNDEFNVDMARAASDDN